jgi:hypothetical protein
MDSRRTAEWRSRGNQSLSSWIGLESNPSSFLPCPHLANTVFTSLVTEFLFAQLCCSRSSTPAPACGRVWILSHSGGSTGSIRARYVLLTLVHRESSIAANRLSEEQFPPFGTQHSLRRCHPGSGIELLGKF